MSKTIAVTGATGNIASLVIPALIKGGATVKALVHTASKAASLAEAGVEVIEGEFTDASATVQLMADADSVLIIAPPNPDAVAQNSALFAAIKKVAKGAHVVRISAIGAAANAPTANGTLHHESDTELIGSGLTHTILRPHFFMQNLFMSVQTIMEQGQMYWGMGEGKLGLIDIRDIADVATEILLNGGHEGEIYTPTGAKSITFKEMAEMIGKVINKEVTYVSVSPEDVKKSIIEMGWGEWGGQLMADYSKAYSENWGDFVNDDVEKVTGNKPRSFEQFVKEVLSHAFKIETA